MRNPKGYQQLVYACYQCPKVDTDYDLEKKVWYRCSCLRRIVDKDDIPEDCPLEDVDI